MNARTVVATVATVATPGEVRGTYSQIMAILEDLISNAAPAFAYSAARRILIRRGRIVHNGITYVCTGGM